MTEPTLKIGPSGYKLNPEKLKNLLLAFPLQVPLMSALVFGVHFLTGLSIWWCIPIAFVLDVMYDAGENIRRGEE
jgi:hypothetical protein